MLDLGHRWSDDPLADFWEEQLGRGETPDLDMTLDSLERLPGWEWVREWRTTS